MCEWDIRTEESKALVDLRQARIRGQMRFFDILDKFDDVSGCFDVIPSVGGFDQRLALLNHTRPHEAE